MLALFALMGATAVATESTNGAPSLPEIAARTVTWLRSSLRGDGRFVYSLNDQTGEVAQTYNVVRHGGVTWALAKYAVDHPDAGLTADVIKANKLSLRQLLVSVPPRGRAIVSDPSIEGGDRPRRAALGGTALNLLAMLAVERLRPGATSPETLRALGRFLVSMQMPTGRFFATYEFARAARTDRFGSLYFAGEALLALNELADWDQSTSRAVWRGAVERGLDFLIRRQDSARPAPDDWAIQAAESYLASQPAGPSRRRSELERFILNVVEFQASHQDDAATDPGDRGCYVAPGRVNATAARLEGMLSALRVLPPKLGRDRGDLRRSVEAALACVIGGQRAPGGFAGQRAGAGGQRPEAHELRMDNAQHALAAIEGVIKIGAQFYGSGRVPTDGELRGSRWVKTGFSNLNLADRALVGVNGYLAHFMYSELGGSSWSRVDARGAGFVESKLARAEFTATRAQGARFLFSDLRRIRFRGTDLRGADFTFSDLRGAAFEGADLNGASFLGAKLNGATYDQWTNLPFAREEAERRGMSFSAGTNTR